jgi:hypothetical protein
MIKFYNSSMMIKDKINQQFYVLYHVLNIIGDTVHALVIIYY